MHAQNIIIEIDFLNLIIFTYFRDLKKKKGLDIRSYLKQTGYTEL